MLYDLENRLSNREAQILEYAHYNGKVEMLPADWPTCDRLAEIGLLEHNPHMLIAPFRYYNITPMGLEMVKFIVALRQPAEGSLV